MCIPMRIEEVCHQSNVPSGSVGTGQHRLERKLSKENGSIWALGGLGFVPLSLLSHYFCDIIEYPRE